MNIKQIITDYIRRSLLTADGAMIARDGGIPTALAAVALGQVLKSGGVATLPAWGVPSMAYVPTAFASYSQSDASDEVRTGFGFTPKLLFVWAGDSVEANMNWSLGIGNAANQRRIAIKDNNGLQDVSGSNFGVVRRDASNHLTIILKSFDVDGLTMEHTLVGTISAAIYLMALG